MGLVDDEQGRHPALALAPQPIEHLEADRQRLGRVVEPAEVEHAHPGAVGRHVGSGGLLTSPGLPLGHPEVLDALQQAPVSGITRLHPHEQLPEVASLARVGEQPHESVVQVLVAHRVELEHGRLGLAGHGAKAQAERQGVAVAVGVRAQHPHAPLTDAGGIRLWRLRLGLAEPDEVGVGVDDRAAQVGLDLGRVVLLHGDLAHLSNLQHWANRLVVTHDIS